MFINTIWGRLHGKLKSYNIVGRKKDICLIIKAML